MTWMPAPPSKFLTAKQAIVGGHEYIEGGKRSALYPSLALAQIINGVPVPGKIGEHLVSLIASNQAFPIHTTHSDWL